MTTPFLGTITLFPYAFAPKGWAFCAGQLLPIAQNQALFALLNTTYGGDGKVNFALPNLQGATAVGAGSGYTIGQSGGEANHTLVFGEMPSHSHSLNADAATSGSSNSTTPSVSVVLGQSTGTSSGSPPTFSMNIYNSAAPANTMNSAAVGSIGGQPHTNMMPSLGFHFCIALIGIYPTRN